MQVKAVLQAARAANLQLRGLHVAKFEWKALALISQTSEIDKTFASLRHLTLHMPLIHVTTKNSIRYSARLSPKDLDPRITNE